MTDNQLDDIDVHLLLAKRRQVAVIWSIGQVRQVRPDLNDDQAWEVLKRCRDERSRGRGFVIWDAAGSLFPMARKPRSPQGGHHD